MTLTISPRISLACSYAFLDLLPLRSKTELRCLEDQVRQLTAWNLMLVDFGVRSSQVSFERRVEQTKLCPIPVNCSNVINIQTRVVFSALSAAHCNRAHTDERHSLRCLPTAEPRYASVCPGSAPRKRCRCQMRSLLPTVLC